ncbi:MAG: site-2 protease family protein [Planctomycetes bacterium]|nr:site-2 protease family protein [Planctomycetota bacterium]
MDKQFKPGPDQVKPVNSNTKDGSAPPAGVEAPPTVKEWWIQNGPVLAIVFALLVYLFIQFDSEGLVAILKAALGLSFVIFLHELGHFLVAKWCDVHVTAFSIGFGPVIPGCWFKWGETTYKLALFPLGGYVQMVGQVDGDESSDGSEEDPRSFRNKSVGARMAIISAGVVMNVILAIACFVVVFQGPGKERDAAIVSMVDAGAPAYKHGIESGDLFVQIGNRKYPYFDDLMATVMASGRDERVDFYIKRAGVSEPIHIQIEPRLGKGDERPIIGVTSASKPQLATPRYVESSLKHPVVPGSPAAVAQPPFEFGDNIIATTDPDDPAQMKELPDDPRFPGHGQRDYFEYARRMSLLAGKEVKLLVERGDYKVEIKVAPAFHHNLGVRMQMGNITAVRDGAQPDVRTADPVRKLEGDLIQKVEVEDVDKDGKPFTRTFEGNTLDPERLPWELRQWADRLDRAKIEGPRKVIVHVRRHRDTTGEQYETKKLELRWNDSERFLKAAPMNATSPMPIPELGIAYQIKTTVDDVTGAQAADEDSLQKGDVIKRVRLVYSDGTSGNKWTDLEPNEWAWVSQIALAAPGGVKSLKLEVSRNQETKEIEVNPQVDGTWPIAERGLILMKDTRIQKASNPLEAVVMGLKETGKNMEQVFQHIRGMITGRLSVKSLGGPGTIAWAAYKFARMDFAQFVFFLGLISVNLAVINFLPIPVLDGGHMVFLIYEKLRGKPASEGIRVGATYAGLAVVLCLMVFVIYLDISRWLL